MLGRGMPLADETPVIAAEPEAGAMLQRPAAGLRSTTSVWLRLANGIATAADATVVDCVGTTCWPPGEVRITDGAPPLPVTSTSSNGVLAAIGTDETASWARTRRLSAARFETGWTR